MEAVTCCTAELCCWAPEASVCELSAITREPSPNWLALSVICPIAARTFSTTRFTLSSKLAVIAGVLGLDRLGEVLVRHGLQRRRRCRRIGAANAFQGLVHALDDLAELALELPSSARVSSLPSQRPWPA